MERSFGRRGKGGRSYVTTLRMSTLRHFQTSLDALSAGEDLKAAQPAHRGSIKFVQQPQACSAGSSAPPPTALKISEATPFRINLEGRSGLISVASIVTVVTFAHSALRKIGAAARQVVSHLHTACEHARACVRASERACVREHYVFVQPSRTSIVRSELHEGFPHTLKSHCAHLFT